MREIILDCKQLSHKSTAHQVISDAFGFPDYYGRNLDALFDLLSCWGEVQVRFSHPEQLGEYGAKILQVFLDATQENCGLRICMKPCKR